MKFNSLSPRHQGGPAPLLRREGQSFPDVNLENTG